MALPLTPVDLAAQSVRQLQASVWCVVTLIDGTVPRRAYLEDEALARAYAAAHRGRIVRLAALDPWPVGIPRDG